MTQDLERDTSAPWDIVPYKEQKYYFPDQDFGSFYGVHEQGQIGFRCVCVCVG